MAAGLRYLGDPPVCGEPPERELCLPDRLLIEMDGDVQSSLRQAIRLLRAKLGSGDGDEVRTGRFERTGKARFLITALSGLLSLGAAADPTPGLYDASHCLSLGSGKSPDRIRALSAPHWLPGQEAEARAIVEKSRLGIRRHCGSADFFRALSREVNRIVSYGYAVDERLYGRPDYWQSAGETLQVKVRSTGERVGDCEDFAVLKLWLAQEAGCGSVGMHVAVLEGEREHHAVLLVELPEGAIVLDNQPQNDGRPFLSLPGPSRRLLFLTGKGGRMWTCPAPR